MMQDALRPDDETFRHFYETGYRQWRRLHLAAVVASPLDVTRLGIQDAFPRHPSFPPRLELNRNSSSVLHATGTSTWETATGDCDLSPLRMSFVFAVTAAYPITISLESNHSAPDLFTSRGNHIPVLTLAWAYVLAARWTEIIPGASVEYTGRLATPRDRGNVSPLVIDVGNVGQEAARWWAAILAPADGWNACIWHRGRPLKSPWSVNLESCTALALPSCYSAVLSSPAHGVAASFSSAVGYILDYASHHQAHDQSHAAFAAALLLPARRSISKRLCWPLPRLYHDPSSDPPTEPTDPPWGANTHQLDKLLTISCNTTGTMSLLSSSFINPDLACNVCGAWI